MAYLCNILGIILGLGFTLEWRLYKVMLIIGDVIKRNKYSYKSDIGLVLLWFSVKSPGLIRLQPIPMFDVF